MKIKNNNLIMRIIERVDQLQECLAQYNNVGFVPTMGALHNGHLELAKQARKECEIVVVSVFVNPTQFNDKRDLERYPRTLDADAKLLESVGVDFVFAPTVEQIYPDEQKYVIEDESILPLTAVMEGAHRPGHFDGVVQVVGRLFDIVNPHKAYFGLKDYQQLAIIRKMVEVQNRSVEIVPCDIVRAEDGLALSSRNSLLTLQQRAVAPLIYRELIQIREKIDAGNHDYSKLVRDAILQINKNEYLCVQYIEVVDAVSLQEPAENKTVRVCAAVMCGDVRLIDNV